MRDVFLHIGMHKTGTSAIQAALARNSDLLRNAGVLYPATGRKGHGHHHLARGLKWDPDNVEILKDLQEEIEREGAPKIILSSEEFEFMDLPEHWTMIVAALGQRPHIICYVRRQSDYLISSYSQQIENGHSHSLDAHIQKILPRLDYLPKLRMLESVMGHDRIILRTYERRRLPLGVVPDFMASIGLQPEGFDLGQQDVNPSLSARGLRIALRVNALIADKDIRRQVSRTILKELPARSDKDKPVLMDETERRNFDAQFLTSNTEIARRYLGRDKLFLDDGRPSDGSPT